jgi:flagellar protein FlaG
MRTDTNYPLSSKPVQEPASPPRRTAPAAVPGLASSAADQPRPSAAELRKAVEQSNQRLAEKGSELSFQLDDELGEVVVRLIDVKTKEVLRQIPSPEALAIAKALAARQERGALLRTDA